MRRTHDRQCLLADPDRFDEHSVHTGRIEYVGDRSRLGGQSARLAATRHAPHEYAGVRGQLTHPHAVTEERPAGERASRVHGNDSGRLIVLAIVPGKLADQGALAHAGRPGQANALREAGARIEHLPDGDAGRVIPLQQRHNPCQGRAVAGEHTLGKIIHYRPTDRQLWRPSTSPWPLVRWCSPGVSPLPTSDQAGSSPAMHMGSRIQHRA